MYLIPSLYLFLVTFSYTTHVLPILRVGRDHKIGLISITASWSIQSSVEFSGWTTLKIIDMILFHVQHEHDLKGPRLPRSWCYQTISLIARFMGPTWDPPASRPQVSAMLAPRTLLSGMLPQIWCCFVKFWDWAKGSFWLWSSQNM